WTQRRRRRGVAPARSSLRRRQEVPDARPAPAAAREARVARPRASAAVGVAVAVRPGATGAPPQVALHTDRSYPADLLLGEHRVGPPYLVLVPDHAGAGAGSHDVRELEGIGSGVRGEAHRDRMRERGAVDRVVQLAPGVLRDGEVPRAVRLEHVAELGAAR